MFDAWSVERFRDRADAGRRLAQSLQHLRADRPVVLALPRGGVVVGYEVARALEAPLDVVVVRKVGAPFQPEFGVGAIVDGEHPEVVLDEEVIRHAGIDRQELEEQIERERAELRRRERLYRAARAPVEVSGKTVIVVDDGIATGSSVRAALRALRRAGPRRLVLATPVAPPQTINALRAEADEVVCLLEPPWFQAVGQFYDNFEQTTDEEVIELLRRAGEGSAAAAPAAAPAARANR